ncbi:MAG: hypothetical protein FWF75_08720, partial [Propionibacteriaceae bacterium]|nr:hypothetical protein [Propionibacteriaceae bacterium]
APVFGAQGGAQPAQEAGLDDDRTRAHPSARLIGGLVLVGLLVVASIAGTAWWVRHSSDAPSTASAQSAAAVQAVQQPDLAANLPPGPVTISCRRSGNSVSCSWSYANALDTDTYRVLLPDGSQQAVEAPSFSHDSAGQFCIQVKVVRADGRFPGDWSQKGCA